MKKNTENNNIDLFNYPEKSVNEQVIINNPKIKLKPYHFIIERFNLKDSIGRAVNDIHLSKIVITGETKLILDINENSKIEVLIYFQI